MSAPNQRSGFVPFVVVAFLATIALIGVTVHQTAPFDDRAEDSVGSTAVTVSSPLELIDLFKERNYAFDAAAAEGVPRIYLSDIPEGWDQGLDADARKDIFFQTLLPLVLRANEVILIDREKLRALAEDKDLSDDDNTWLLQLGERYGVVDDGETQLSKKQLSTLIRRVDVIPPSLALGQGAYESAYGTSRFAEQGNALFGQWRWGKGAMKPKRQRTELGNYGIAAFKTPLASVRAYMLNLNTHPAYRPLRDLRAEARNEGRALSGPALAAGLERYSERGQVYIDTLRKLIQTNALSRLDRAKLRDEPPVRLQLAAEN